MDIYDGLSALIIPLFANTLYANFVNNSIPFYIMTLRNALKTGDYSESVKYWKHFNKNQHNIRNSRNA